MVQTPPLNESQSEENCKPGDRPPYPVVTPADGHEYGRPGFYPLAHPLPQRPL